MSRLSEAVHESLGSLEEVVDEIDAKIREAEGTQQAGALVLLGDLRRIRDDVQSACRQIEEAWDS